MFCFSFSQVKKDFLSSLAGVCLSFLALTTFDFLLCFVDPLRDVSRFLQNIPTTPEPPTSEYLFTAPYLPSFLPNGIFIRECYFRFAAQIVTMLKQSSSSASSASAAARDFYLVGVWGSSGIGKTAFGYYLVYRLRREFPTCSFVWTAKQGSICLDGHNRIQSSSADLPSPVFHISDDIVPDHTQSFAHQLYVILYSGTPTGEWRAKLVFPHGRQTDFYMPLWYYFFVFSFNRLLRLLPVVAGLNPKPSGLPLCFISILMALLNASSTVTALLAIFLQTRTIPLQPESKISSPTSIPPPSNESCS
jgi:hypothetical protein